MTTLRGPSLSDVDWIGACTIGAFTEEVCARYAANEALVFDDPLRGGTTVRWTYGDVRREARRVARAVVASGLGKGARVGVLMGNRPEAVAALLGAPMAGAVAVPLSTFSPLPELEYLLRHADISVLLTQTRLLAREFAAEATALDRTQFPYLRRVAAVGDRSWDEFLASGDHVGDAALDGRLAEVHESDHGLIIYSSGTTDRPKGMLHTNRGPALQFWFQRRYFGRHERTRLWTALPIFWSAGFITAMGASLAGGSCWVMQETFEPGEALRLMAREHVTEPYSLPHQTAAITEHPDWLTTDLSSLRCVYGKSAFARHPTVDGDTSWQMTVSYGLSETNTAVMGHAWDAGREAVKRSMGRLLPGYELRIVDPDTGVALGPDEDGEFAIRGPTLMDHYVKMNRDECFDADGFFHTGDAGYFDDDGYVHFTGRRTEMIKTGGANVSPAELEVQLRACEPVKLARVVGVPDPRLDQIVVLAVTLKEGAHATEDDIRGFLRERVAAYKVPKKVLFFDDGEIPMTESETKVRDPELLALVEARLREAASAATEEPRSLANE
ncbi:MAG TPA: class I adenylate-forming enzyme family protein [Acidimicrobiia bacterium]|nr:class I adenylate-forming enzyme family protein [Acidimicrobiia bacterium]